MKSFPGSTELADYDHHPFTIIRDDKGVGDLSKENSNIDLEELHPPQDRVVVREDISVKYSNV